MITNLDIEKIFELYNKYFDIISKNQGRLENPINFSSESDKSNALASFSKYNTFYDSVISQALYDTDASKRLFELLSQSLASNKSILNDLQDTSNPFKVKEDLLNNLIKSFGFPFVDFNNYTNKQILLNLVKNYKIKGTLQSVKNMLDITIPGRIGINEIYFEKINNTPYFTESIVSQIPGNDEIKTKLLYDVENYTRLDPHWMLSRNDLQSYPVNKAMSPYFGVDLFINTESNIIAIELLRTNAAKEYEIYLDGKESGDMTDYENTKTIKIDLLPKPINYLELYEFIRYLYTGLNNLNNDVDDVLEQPSYTYTPLDDNADIIIDETESQFKTRYCNDFGTIESKISNCKIVSKIRNIPVINYPSQAASNTYMINNLHNAGFTVMGNKLIIVGGKFSDTSAMNTKMYIGSPYSLDDPIYEVELGISIIDPIVAPSSYCNKVCITGGYNEDGTKNYKTYLVNLLNYQVTQISDISPTVWMKNPYLVTSNKITYIISRDDNDYCKGSISIWNICRNYKELKALIDPNDYDLSTIKGSVDKKNRLFITVKSKLSGGTRILMLDPDPRYELFVDITELLIKQMSGVKRRQFAKLLFNNEPIISLSGDFLFLIYKDEKTNKPIYHTFRITYEESSTIKEKIKPKLISGMLIPSRISKPCKEYVGGKVANKKFCNLDFSEEGLEFVGLEEIEPRDKNKYCDRDYPTDLNSLYDTYNIYDKSSKMKVFFAHVKSKKTGEIAYYWPLFKQLETTCCNGPSTRITKFIPGYGKDIYDTYWTFDFDTEAGFGHPVYGQISPYEDCHSTMDITIPHYKYDMHKIYDQDASGYNTFNVCKPILNDEAVYSNMTQWSETCYFFYNIDEKTQTFGVRSNIGSFTYDHVFSLKHDEITNNHYSYELYDAVTDYDIENKISIISYSAYPDLPDKNSYINSDIDDPSMKEYGMSIHDKLKKLYDFVEIPEYIKILNDYYIEYVLLENMMDVDGVLSCKNISLNNMLRGSAMMCDREEGTQISLISMYPYLIELMTNCDLSYTPSTLPQDENDKDKICREYFARDLRKDTLIRRYSKDVTDENKLPIFESFDDLANFLYETSADNKIAIDASYTKADILFNLLTIVSQLYKDSDLNIIQPNILFRNIMTITDLFKPYYSRLLVITPLITLSDPIGDWIAMEDSININFFKRVTSYLHLDDCMDFGMARRQKEFLNLKEIFKRDLKFDMNHKADNLNIKEKIKYKPTLSFIENSTAYMNRGYKYDTNKSYDSLLPLHQSAYKITPYTLDKDELLNSGYKFDTDRMYDAFAFEYITQNTPTTQNTSIISNILNDSLRFPLVTDDKIEIYYKKNFIYDYNYKFDSDESITITNNENPEYTDFVKLYTII